MDPRALQHHLRRAPSGRAADQAVVRGHRCVGTLWQVVYARAGACVKAKALALWCASITILQFLTLSFGARATRDAGRRRPLSCRVSLEIQFASCSPSRSPSASRLSFAGFQYILRHASGRRAGNRVQAPTRCCHVLCSDHDLTSSDELGRPDALALVELVANLAGARCELARACEILARGVHLAGLGFG